MLTDHAVVETKRRHIVHAICFCPCQNWLLTPYQCAWWHLSMYLITNQNGYECSQNKENRCKDEKQPKVVLFPEKKQEREKGAGSTIKEWAIQWPTELKEDPQILVTTKWQAFSPQWTGEQYKLTSKLGYFHTVKFPANSKWQPVLIHFQKSSASQPVTQKTNKIRN